MRDLMSRIIYGQDKEAQEAFYFHWAMWAKRFASKTPKQISFDLVNEPCTREDMNDQHSRRGPIPGELYREVAKKSLETIRSHNPNHMVIADGNNVGSDVIPEIFDLPIGQSCRGYFPHYISHYRAPWVLKIPMMRQNPFGRALSKVVNLTGPASKSFMNRGLML
jgi:endoglucanase